MNKTVAVVDVGTLKCKFEIRQFNEDKTSILLYKDKQLTVIGRDLDKSNNIIIEKPIIKTIEALKSFYQKMDEFKVDKYMAVATEAIRKATNSQDVLKRIKDETGIELITLTHDEEAELYFHSVSKDFPKETIAVTDIGGGSVQVIIGKDDEIYEKYLFKTGSYFLQENFSKSLFPSSQEVKNAFNYVRDELKTLKDSKYTPHLLIYGSTNIQDFFQAMNLNMSKRLGNSDHNLEISIKELLPLYKKIINLSYEDRMLLYPAEPYYMWGADKALMNIFTISEYLKVDTIVPSNNNISSGILLNLALK